MTHDELIGRAIRWLKNSMHCDCVLAEPNTANNYEFPDAIGWHTGRSIVVECKASLRDFHRDKKKPSRRNSKGMGRLRYYLTPQGLLKNVTLPKYWGWLECYPKLILRAIRAKPVPDNLVFSIGECDILVKRIGDRL